MKEIRRQLHEFASVTFTDAGSEVSAVLGWNVGGPPPVDQGVEEGDLLVILWADAVLFTGRVVRLVPLPPLGAALHASEVSVSSSR